MVYTAGTLSLAALEHFVHLEPEDDPEDLVARSGNVPDRLETETLDLSSLPSGWRRYPAPDELAETGTVWATARRTAVLRVPSAIVPHEWNYVLNPRHADFTRIRIGAPTAFRFDPRLWKRRPLG